VLIVSDMKGIEFPEKCRAMSKLVFTYECCTITVEYRRKLQVPTEVVRLLVYGGHYLFIICQQVKKIVIGQRHYGIAAARGHQQLIRLAERC